MATLRWRITPDMQLEATCGEVKDAFKVLSSFAVLGNNSCGKCKSTNVHPDHRVAQGIDFYEMRCVDCGARLSFGQHKVGGTLFPKTDKGWHHYQQGDDDQGQSRPQQQQAQEFENDPNVPF